MSQVARANAIRKSRELPAIQQFNDSVRLCEISTADSPAEFSAWVNGELVIASSRTPYFDAARALLEQGADSNSILVLRHRGSTTNGMVGKLGILARLSVKEPDKGRAHFARYIPIASSPVASRVRQIEPVRGQGGAGARDRLAAGGAL